MKQTRQKAIFFINGENQTKPTAHKTGFTFGLNSTKCPPQVKDLMLFEEDLIKLVKNPRIQKVDNKFKRTLANLRSSNKTLTPNDDNNNNNNNNNNKIFI